MPIEDVQAHTPLEEYGIDSILIVQLTNRVREDIPDISSTLFFEYPTIGGLAEYLVSSRQDDMAGIFKTNKEAEKRRPLPNRRQNTLKWPLSVLPDGIPELKMLMSSGNG